MFELVLALALAAAIGWLRPRRSSLWIAAVPAGLAFVWFLLHEDIPGESTGVGDIVWYVGMSLVVCGAFAAACCLGIAARRTVSGSMFR